MATRSKRRRTKRLARDPNRLSKPRVRANWLPWAGVVVAALAVAIGALIAQRADEPSASSARGLPQTRDFHSLIVSSGDPNRILLGTHQGVYRSTDGGRAWRLEGLSGNDAMNLARNSSTLWAAGHDVLAKSVDGGRTWSAVEPRGLPSLDVHAFAVDRPRGELYAAVAAKGIYRSSDGGKSFRLVSRDPGASVTALAVTADGQLLAADTTHGLLESRDGAKWRGILRTQLAGLAAHPHRPRLILATGPGILLSTNGGRSWRQVLKLDRGAGPVAWAPNVPGTGDVVGFDRTLYRTRDGGVTWRAVT
jgi:photosystem II stability/assembly factor-like uncharacterized protein